MPSIMQDIKSLHPLLIFFIFEPPYLALKIHCCFNIEPYPLYVCVYQGSPQTLAEICKNMGMAIYVLKAMAMRVIYIRVYLIMDRMLSFKMAEENSRNLMARRVFNICFLYFRARHYPGGWEEWEQRTNESWETINFPTVDILGRFQYKGVVLPARLDISKKIFRCPTFKI